MARFYYIILTILSLYLCSGDAHMHTVNGTLNIQIGMTAGCRFAQWFMNQVGTTFNKYGRYLKFEFTPWGRTERGADGNLICQFGEADCWANRVHRCVISLLKENQAALVRYMVCEFSEPYPAYRQKSLACVQRVNLSIIAVDYCVSTSYGDRFEFAAEERSRQGMAVINRLPFIIFNDVADEAIWQQALQNLERVVCNALAADPATSVTRC